jgi:hypothetical protein
LPALDHGHRGRARLVLRIFRRLTREEPPDVVKTMCYRPGFFGAYFTAPLQAVMRGPSEWTVGERELFAAYTSRLNQCPF